ncbi:sensor histidine kinase KdpD, partial [Methanocalculus sp.]|uniref:sensor histidine kinase n=1 Tax=Methanocalculus sp. TaxID=2004547 RepID=UPI00271F2A0D
TTFIKRIDTAAEKISAMISFTKDYEGIGAAMPVWQNLRGLIDQATVQSQPGTPVVQNEIPGDREVFADPLILKVIENLIDNAVRHGGDITRIFFSLHEKEKNLLIICEDDGQGIVTAWKERIFDQGFGQNTGFGLTLSREILAITGITIRETGVHGKGARFEITVPDGGWRRVEER